MAYKRLNNFIIILLQLCCPHLTSALISIWLVRFVYINVLLNVVTTLVIHPTGRIYACTSYYRLTHWEKVVDTCTNIWLLRRLYLPLHQVVSEVFERKYILFVHASNCTTSFLIIPQELSSENDAMDNIWYKNPSKSEVIGRCGGDEINEWPRRTDKGRTLKKKI